MTQNPSAESKIIKKKTNIIMESKEKVTPKIIFKNTK